MYTLGPEEKATTIIAYTHSSLIRGEVVTRENVRVSVWLRMDGTPEFMRIHNAHIINLSGAQARPAKYAEILVPSSSLIGFHIAPPAHDPLDYDENDGNRTHVPVSVLMGAFILKGRIRISAQSDLATTIATTRIHWMSIYDAQITAPQLTQMPAIQVPMLVVHPTAVSFVLE
ncbi:MAG: hypothetical protein Q7J80_03730 [Anaerolineales bacterium]|nr:hypothetical protein [Anaerolineales bacterium]